MEKKSAAEKVKVDGVNDEIRNKQNKSNEGFCMSLEDIGKGTSKGQDLIIEDLNKNTDGIDSSYKSCESSYNSSYPFEKTIKLWKEICGSKTEKEYTKTNEDQVLDWLLHRKSRREIADITDETLERLIEKTGYFAVLLYDKVDAQDMRMLNKLENIDEGLEKKFDFSSLPAFVVYGNKFGKCDQGDVMQEDILEVILQLRESTPDVIENVGRKTLQVPFVKWDI